jgi:DNA polymerase III gamma/tau subunit
MHAYLVLSDNKDLDIQSIVSNLYEPVRKHIFSKIKIDDVRSLNNFLLTRGQESHIIYFDSFLDIAQNAFLKTLEEPNNEKQIILVTKSRANILDTLISRLHVIDVANSVVNKKGDFVGLNIIERLEVVKKILDSEHDDVRPNAQKLISQILNTSDKKLTSDQKQTLAKLHDSLFESGTSAKQVLEFLAVTL